MTLAQIRHALIDDPDRRLRADTVLSRTAIISGVIFFFAGLVKFVFHHWELHAFHDFGLPLAPELEILAGVLETGGGVLLVLRRGVVPVSLFLLATMTVATVAAGIIHGSVIPSLTLAPILWFVMLYLLLRTTVLPPQPAESSPDVLGLHV